MRILFLHDNQFAEVGPEQLALRSAADGTTVLGVTEGGDTFLPLVSFPVLIVPKEGS